MLVRDLSPALGSEVVGVDATEPLSESVLSELREVFASRHLLLFPGQELSDEDHLRLAGYFGPVLTESRGKVTRISNVLGQGPQGVLPFHSDNTFTSEPPLAISLYGEVVPAAGAPTLYADAARACRLLSPTVRAEVEGRSAVHCLDPRLPYGQRSRLADMGPEGPDAPRALHPVLKAHPVTGEEVLFITQPYTDHIVGLTPERSEELIQECLALIFAPDNVYEHRWRPHDLVIWDNICVQHARPDWPGEERTLRRVVLGTHSLAEQIPGWRMGDEYRNRLTTSGSPGTPSP